MKKLFQFKDFVNSSEELQELKTVTFKDVMNGRLLTKKLFTGQIYFIFLGVALGFLYISNHYTVERLQNELYMLNREVKELRYEAVTTSSDLMSMSKQSEVLERMRARGVELNELTEPPRVLYVPE